MYPATHAEKTPDKAAYVMARSGRVVTYRELDERSNQGAQLFHSLGLRRGDHIAFCMENNAEYFALAWAAQRSGLYYTAISSRLTASEAEYIIDDCGAQVFITSEAKRELAEALAEKCPRLTARFMVGAPSPGYDSWEEALAAQPTAPLEEESEGAMMLYSSGTTGRPKGVKHPLPEGEIGKPTPILGLLLAMYGATGDSVYLSPAPLYHAAPLGFTMSFLRLGCTVVVMEEFDALESLRLIEKHRVTHSQWVPTMFVRMLKLPEEDRAPFDVSSLRVAIHAAAPCPIPVKETMIEWWGPVLYEYYAGTEGNGFCALDSEEWLAHKGSVGKPLNAVVHILNEEFEEQPTRGEGGIYFESAVKFEYHNAPEKTAESRSPEGYSTLGDVGFLDEDGFLYLTDRKAHMIISGGVNIYPQETENALITHPKVADVAVIGVPNEDFGEEVKAVVQLLDPDEASPELAQALIDFCQEQISKVKCPRSVDFEAELPRHPTGKLYKRLLKDRYWASHASKIV
ncbi:MAG: AMP-binding protein [Deltaproteobacteria bacterium]|nr:AMP-binding protein [Deltaproteobacteria bacterium]MBW2446132.1 AMP-binding protein [Deltaproteobacteria bacterium]